MNDLYNKHLAKIYQKGGVLQNRTGISVNASFATTFFQMFASIPEFIEIFNLDDDIYKDIFIINDRSIVKLFDFFISIKKILKKICGIDTKINEQEEFEKIKKPLIEINSYDYIVELDPYDLFKQIQYIFNKITEIFEDDHIINKKIENFYNKINIHAKTIKDKPPFYTLELQLSSKNSDINTIINRNMGNYTFYKYIIIYITPQKKGSTITLSGQILFNNNVYNLDSSICCVNNKMYYYQEYDGIGGNTVEYTYEDANKITGAVKYTEPNYPIMILYTLEINPSNDIINQSNDTIINQVIKEYCTHRQNICIYGNIYDPKKRDNTSYKKYITTYPTALLIINDNYADSKTDILGGGNASDYIRRYNIYSFEKHKYLKPRIAGISTGPHSEYLQGVKLDTVVSELDNKTPRQVIDDEIKLIKYIMIKWNYTDIIYSSNFVGELDTQIFNVPVDIKRYITSKIMNLGSKRYIMKYGKMNKELKIEHKYINILN